MTTVRLNDVTITTASWQCLQKHWNIFRDMDEKNVIELDEWLPTTDSGYCANIRKYMVGIIANNNQDYYRTMDWQHIDQVWHAMEILKINCNYHNANDDMISYFEEFLQGSQTPFNCVRAMVQDLGKRSSKLWTTIVLQVNNRMLKRWQDFSQDCDTKMHLMNPNIDRTVKELRNVIDKYWHYKVTDSNEITLVGIDDSATLVKTIAVLGKQDIEWLVHYFTKDLIDIFAHMVWCDWSDHIDRVLTAIWQACKVPIRTNSNISDEMKMILMGVRKFSMVGTAADWQDLTDTIDETSLQLKYQEQILYYFVLNTIGMRYHHKWTLLAMRDLLSRKNQTSIKGEEWSITKLWVQWLQRLYHDKEKYAVREICDVWNVMGLANRFKYGVQVFNHYAYEMDDFNKPIPRTIVTFCQKYVLSEPWVFKNVNEAL